MENKTKEITISVRRVYHKYAEITLDVPSSIDNKDVEDFLYENEVEYINDLNQKFSEADYQVGFGLGGGMVDADNEYEKRFDVKGTLYGKHMA